MAAATAKRTDGLAGVRVGAGGMGPDVTSGMGCLTWSYSPATTGSNTHSPSKT